MKSEYSVLDRGSVKYIEHWGSDERIIESARVSTNKGFQGWVDDFQCRNCNRIWPFWEYMDSKATYSGSDGREYASCCGISASFKSLQEGDEKLLAYLYNNHHGTPFEMAGLTIEVTAPVFVFREWHRHRTQSYNEMSARYTPLPYVNYVPTSTRILTGVNKDVSNKQAQGSGREVTQLEVDGWLDELKELYNHSERVYQKGIALGIPKELARLPVPVARYSKMRASANLRNWLHFLNLRMAANAQWEIRQYANAVNNIINNCFPRTWKLFTDRFAENV